MHMGFGCKPYTNAKCKLSWQFLSNCKDLNDLLTVYLKQGNLQEGSRNMNQELHYMFWEWNQQRRTKKCLPGNLHESNLLWLWSTASFSFPSLSLPSASQQLHHLIPFSAVLQFLRDGLLLSEREERELHDLKAWENDIENILPSAKFHVPEDITPVQ